MSEYLIQDSTLSGIADAIRTKAGVTGTLSGSAFESNINSILTPTDGTIPSIAAKTITPTTSNQTAVSSGYYTTGAITVKGDSNLVAGNIKSGTSIFGVTGTLSTSATVYMGEMDCTASNLTSATNSIMGNTFLYLTFPVKVKKIVGFNIYGYNYSSSKYAICAAHLYYAEDSDPQLRYNVNSIINGTNSVNTGIWWLGNTSSYIGGTDYQALVSYGNVSTYINTSYPTFYTVLYYYTD